MVLKQNSISELKDKLAQSLKILRDGKGAKQKLKRIIEGVTKGEHPDQPEKSSDLNAKNGIKIFGNSAFRERNQHINNSRGHTVKTDDEEGLSRVDSAGIKTTKLEDEGNLKNLLKP